MANNNAPISEEIVAAISAAVEMMIGKKCMGRFCGIPITAVTDQKR